VYWAPSPFFTRKYTHYLCIVPPLFYFFFVLLSLVCCCCCCLLCEWSRASLVRTMAASSGRVCSTRSVSLFLQTLLCSCMICTSLCAARALATQAGAAGSGTDLVYSYCSIWLRASSRGSIFELRSSEVNLRRSWNFFSLSASVGLQDMGNASQY
jgi:hypothetical protein